MLEQEVAVARFAAVAQTPGLITGELRARLLVALSATRFTDDASWQAATGAFLDTTATILKSVRLEKSSTITLLANRESLLVSVINELDQPVTVFINVRPLRPLLAVEDTKVELTLEPNSQARGSIPVQALSNGEVELRLAIYSSGGLLIGNTSYVRTTVFAGWEGPVTTVLGILVVLLFGFGIVRTVLKRRTVRGAGPDSDGDGTSD
jgi:hypothetical protein